MATVILDDARYARLRTVAEANGRTVEDEVRVLVDERLKSRAAVVSDLRRFQAEMKQKYGVLPDSTPLLRQLREAE